MAKLNKGKATAKRPVAKVGTGPVKTRKQPTTVTGEGSPAYTRKTKGELFLLGLANMVAEKTFYESGAKRDARFAELVRAVALKDPKWLNAYLGWLREEANMRSAPVVGAAEAAHAMWQAEVPGGREVIRKSLARADEPGEFLAYWIQHFGKPVPKSVKRGLYDSAVKLYNEYTLLKYDADAPVRFADVIELSQGPNDFPLWKYALDRRHDNVETIPAELPMIQKRSQLNSIPVKERRAQLAELVENGELEAAGYTWEALSGWIDGPMTAEVWEAVIPTMGYMALLRNLRNFDKAGISEAAVAKVTARLSDPAQVARSKQFPFRFLNAYKHIEADHWRVALGKALKESTGNIPELPGRSLVLVDTSGSMQSPLSEKSSLNLVEAAALFGVSVAYRMGVENVDLFGFAGGWGVGPTFRHVLPKGGSPLKQVEKFNARVGEVGHGTDIAGAMREWNGHDRVFLFSDMQTATAVPKLKVPVYAFNLGGYRATPFKSGGNVTELGGLSDGTFKLIPILERGEESGWPWEV